MKAVDPKALFRLSVLGPLVSRETLERGELQRFIREAAQREYVIPGSRRRHVGEKTIEAWFYAYQRGGLDALCPKPRVDRGQCKLTPVVQEALLAAKRDNPRRSIRQLRDLLLAAGTVAAGALSRSAIHRLLQQHGLSRISGSASEAEERRSYVAEFAGTLWYGDVMHGPTLSVGGRQRKTYLVSLMDDASRLVAHSAFCLSETALAIEGVLKQALLKRGLPRKLVVDNGAAYRAHTLQGICARLGIQLIYCRPYAPEGKGKLERWHRTVRDQFLSEINPAHVSLDDLNARLWAWLEQVYHQRPHGGLAGATPLARYQQDLPRIRSLGARAATLDALFHHRTRRHVRRDGTVAYLGQRFEVPYELAGKTVQLVIDPQAEQVLGVEGEDGDSLGPAVALDPVANCQRVRHKPSAVTSDLPATRTPCNPALNPVELAHQRHYGDTEA
jgi:transposase InsO family protein